MSYPVITISREFGSGGRRIGEEIAKRLNIELYDKTIIEMVAEKSGFTVDFVEENDQRLSRSMLFQIAVTGTLPPWITAPKEEVALGGLFETQAEIIRELASKGGCVIVGRCADYILRDDPNRISVFIRGETKDKAQRCVKEYGLGPNLAQGEMLRRDKERADYYNHYTGRTWGNAENYDICLNSSLFGIEGCVDMIISAIKELQNK